MLIHQIRVDDRIAYNRVKESLSNSQYHRTRSAGSTTGQTRDCATSGRRAFDGLRTVIFAVIFVAATSVLAACSKQSEPLADYIRSICAAPFHSAPASEGPYLAENISAMTKMMVDMGIRPSGDVDSDFVEMMVPHHQGAIDMAQAELRYGHNETLRRMAQEIIVTQQQEIVAMRLALAQQLPPSAPAPDQLSAAQIDSRSNSPTR